MLLTVRWQCGNGTVSSASECGAVAAAPGTTSASAVDGRALRAARPRQTGPQQKYNPCE